MLHYLGWSKDTIRWTENNQRICSIQPNYGKSSDEYAFISETEMISCASQLIEAVLHLHENDIVHRDITPNNVLIDEQGKVTVIDFDLICENNSLNSVRGTPGYVPPDVANHLQKEDHKAVVTTAWDAFSIAKTLKKWIENTTKFDTKIISEIADRLQTQYTDANALKTSLKDLTEPESDDLIIHSNNLKRKAYQPM